ncbi:MAG TPA: NAD-dependent epimerase/dehydratase family protein [Mycobacteriales bacterium]|jgi:nucleoside-diphosphate-sugar epimerase|nr:NAD-dependent epimerase/dehydratase family protein [Mycobacteriales bacterium]
MRIVVVGASGNVGTAVLRRLAAERAVTELVGVARRPPTGAGHPYDAARWESVDIGADDATTRLAGVLAGADAVLSLAWRLQPSWDRAALERINVRGTRAVVDAALAAGVPRLVYSSSIGAYAPSPGPERRDESWPTTGIATSTYSRQKAAVERMLDEVDPGRLAVLRVRPGIVLQPAAAGEIARFFLGPLVPTSLIRPKLLPVLPWPRGLRGQIVHADDLADAFARGLLTGATGGLNVATEPLLTRALVADLLGARPFDVPPRAVRGLVSGSWRLHLQPTDAGWIDMAGQVPVMDTGRARGLGWAPARPTREVLREFLAALADGTGTGSPALAPRTPVFGRRPTG